MASEGSTLTLVDASNEECGLLLGESGKLPIEQSSLNNSCQKQQQQQKRLLQKLVSYLPTSTTYLNHHQTNSKTHSKQNRITSSTSQNGSSKRAGSSFYSFLGQLNPNQTNSPTSSWYISSSTCPTTRATSSSSSVDPNNDYYYEDDDNDAADSNCKRFYPNSNTNKRPKCGQFLAILLVTILFLGSIFLLAKLLDLIENQKLTSERVILNKSERSVELSFNRQLEDAKASRWLVSSPKCHIPVIDPWHESIKDYVEIKEPLNCTKVLFENSNGTEKETSLTYVKGNRLYISRSGPELTRAIEDCCFRQVVRDASNDDDLTFNETCTKISENGMRSPFELLQIECPKHNYKNAHSFVLHKHEEEEALSRVARKRLGANQYYNVVLIGVDTISRLNGYRQLNKTLTLLRKRYKTIEYFGYNKVGENTFPNLIPFLTGLRPEQLTETQCWLASNYSDATESGDDYLDNCKYLWNHYQELGYVTYFSEDWPKASTFNYLKQGFKQEPTNFYGRPFTLARDSLLLPPVKMGCSSCLLDKPIVEVDLANLKSFIIEHKHQPHFAFHWINCPQHDDLNGASTVDNILRTFFKGIHKLTQDDKTFVVFFSDHGYRWNNFVSTRVGHYESSLPLLTIAPPKRFIERHRDLYKNMVRHQSALLTPFDMFKTLIKIRNLGMTKKTSSKLHRIDDTSSSTKIEPTPTSETKSSPSNESNDLSHTTSPTAMTTVKQLKPLDGISYKQSFKAISLLSSYNLSEIDRSCTEAGIPDNYCVCHEFESIDTSSDDVLGAAYYLIYVHLYKIIMEQKQICASLDLEEIHEAELYDFKKMKSLSNNGARRRRDSGYIKENSVGDDSSSVSTTTAKPATRQEVIDERHSLPNREYNIRLSTRPGGGLFQEVVRYYGDDLEKCLLEVRKVKVTIDSYAGDDDNDGDDDHYVTKHNSVMSMNEVCKFSIHSDSISRLNLYKEQSKCVKSNIELKKICYCKDN